MRVLGRVRLSRSTEESTSVERQREVIQQWAEREGHEIVGWAVDDGVSGSIDPFRTPELGPWLTDPERLEPFDVIAAWKLDRLGRNASELHRLFSWAEEHEKTIVSATENIDLGSWSGKMLASVIAGLAEGELEAIRERQIASRQKLRSIGRWPGGQFPYGYVPAVNPDGPGYILVVDPEGREVIEGLVSDVLGGRGVAYAVKRLNDSGVLVPADHRRKLRGKKPDPTKRWHQQTVRQILRSPALLGHQVVKGQTIRDDDGDPVLIGEPLISFDEFERLQAELSPKRTYARRADPYPLGGIVVCYGCHRPLHHSRNISRGREYTYLRHPAEVEPGPECSVTPIPESYAAKLVEVAFLDDVGDLEAVERVWVPGDSRDEEIRAALAALDELTALVASLGSESAKRRLEAQIRAKDAELVELEAAPRAESQWKYKSLGQTYRDLWEVSTEKERRDLLLRAGIVVALRIDAGQGRRSKTAPGITMFNVLVPDDLRERLASQSDRDTQRLYHIQQYCAR